MVNTTHDYTAIQEILKRETYPIIFIHNNIRFRLRWTIMICTQIFVWYYLSGHLSITDFKVEITESIVKTILQFIPLFFIVLSVFVGIIALFKIPDILCNGYRFSSRGIEKVFLLAPSTHFPWECCDIRFCEEITLFNRIKNNGSKKLIYGIDKKQTEKITPILATYAFNRASYIEKSSPVVVYMESIKLREEINEEKLNDKSITEMIDSNKIEDNLKSKDIFIPNKTDVFDWTVSSVTSILTLGLTILFFYTLIISIENISKGDFSFLVLQILVLGAIPIFILKLIRGMRMPFCKGYHFSSNGVEVRYSFFPNRTKPWKNMKITIYSEYRNVFFTYNNWEDKEQYLCILYAEDMEKSLPYVHTYGIKQIVNIEEKSSLIQYEPKS